jgi:hypothetical protein
MSFVPTTPFTGVWSVTQPSDTGQFANYSGSGTYTISNVGAVGTPLTLTLSGTSYTK